MTMTIPNNSSAKRITVQIPTSSGDAIEAWVYLPEGSGPHPAVVMAHGIGGIKAGGLAPFAERFREEGFAAIAFDYRNFGGSGGQPREVLSVPRQRADYSTDHCLGHVLRRHARRRTRCLRHSTGRSGRPGPAHRRLGRSDDVPAQEREPTLRTGPARPFRLPVRSTADLHPRSRNARGPFHRRHAGRPVRGEADDPEGWDGMARPRGSTVSAQLLLASTRAPRRLRACPFPARCPRG